MSDEVFFCFAVETNAVIHRPWLRDLHQGLYSAKITDILSSCMCSQYNPSLIKLEGIFSTFCSSDFFNTLSSRDVFFYASSKVRVVI